MEVSLQWSVLSRSTKGTRSKGTSSSKDASRRPAGRAHHAACIVDSRFMLVHGGHNGLRALSCSWLLDLATSTWIEVGLTTATGESSSSQLIPSARYGHSLTYFQDCRLVVLIGGLDAGKHVVEDNAFTMRVPDEPCSRQDWQRCCWMPLRFPGASHFASKLAVNRGLHSTCLVNARQMFVFGGTDDENAVCPSHASSANLFLMTNQTAAKSTGVGIFTSEPKTCGQGPGERYGHAACVVETGATPDVCPVMLIIGGIDPRTRAKLRDVFHLDLSPLTDAASGLTQLPFSWTRINIQPSPRLPPMAYHTATSIPTAGSGLPNGTVLLLWGSREGRKAVRGNLSTKASAKAHTRSPTVGLLLLEPCRRVAMAGSYMTSLCTSIMSRKRSKPQHVMAA